jgi:hypothetical protein
MAPDPDMSARTARSGKGSVRWCPPSGHQRTHFRPASGVSALVSARPPAARARPPRAPARAAARARPRARQSPWASSATGCHSRQVASRDS